MNAEFEQAKAYFLDATHQNSHFGFAEQLSYIVALRFLPKGA
jgi:hypothetical protein